MSDDRRRLYNHRDVARMVGITTRRMREWCERGTWPRPHSVVEQTWFYRREDVEHFIAEGRWPDGMRYRSGVGRGRASPG